MSIDLAEQAVPRQRFLSDAEVDLAQRIASDFINPDPRIYWLDLTLATLAAWSLFALGYASGLPWPLAGLLFVFASFAVCRALSAVHDLAHLSQRAPRGFSLAWDLVVGLPTMTPSIVYLGVHEFHHRVSVYGTKEDPQYLLGSKGSWRGLAGFLLLNLLFPLICAIRFLVLAPLSLFSRRFREHIEVHYSSLQMNPFKRRLSARERRQLVGSEIAIGIFWYTVILLVMLGRIDGVLILGWLAVVGLGFALIGVRAIADHGFVSDGAPWERTEILADSNNHVGGGILTEIWAPLGTRYHALHHLLPYVPYHHLGRVHQKLLAALPPDSRYHSREATSLWRTLASFANRKPARPVW